MMINHIISSSLMIISGKKQRIAYGQTLLEIVAKSSGKKDIMSTAFLNSTMVSGGKDEMKKRIMMISKGRKTSRIALILAIILSVVCIGCTFGEPVKEGVQGTDSSVSVQKIESNDFQGSDVTEDWYSNQVFDLFDEIPNVFEEETNVELETKTFVWPTESKIISNGFGERKGRDKESSTLLAESDFKCGCCLEQKAGG